MSGSTRCGYITIVGRANVGKSTLFNALLERELSIATNKPQTTRHNIQGVLTTEQCQLVFIDTPGIQLGNKRLINKVLINNAVSSLQSVDVILMVVELDQWGDEDEYLLKQIAAIDVPVIACINKIDKIKDKQKLLPMLTNLQDHHSFEEIFPISALKDKQFAPLLNSLCALSPEADFLFPEDFVWDRDEKFIIAEIIRGAAIIQLQKELPYAIYTEVEAVDHEQDLTTILVVIWVEKESQKPIVIGNKGSKIKAIGEQARFKLEKIFNHKVMLKTWVKVKQNWQDQQSVVTQFKT